MTDSHARPDPTIGGHLIADALAAQGVDTIFGVPGESYLAVLDGLWRHRDAIRFVICRQEGGRLSWPMPTPNSPANRASSW